MPEGSPTKISEQDVMISHFNWSVLMPEGSPTEISEQDARTTKC